MLTGQLDSQCLINFIFTCQLVREKLRNDS